MPTRPLSPHLSVYKFRYTMLTSILNRFTGVGTLGGSVAARVLADGGRGRRARPGARRPTPVACQWRSCSTRASSSPSAITSSPASVISSGTPAADSSAPGAQRSAWLVGAVSVALMLVIGYCAWLGGARAPMSLRSPLRSGARRGLGEAGRASLVGAAPDLGRARAAVDLVPGVAPVAAVARLLGRECLDGARAPARCC